MATQVDSLGSFKSFRPWRHRDNGAGGSGHSGSNSHDSTHDVQDTRPDDNSSRNVRQLPDLHVVKKERPPPSQRENHRPRSTSTFVSSPPSSQSPPQRISASHPAQADVSVDTPPASPATATQPLSSISISNSVSTDDTPRTPGPIVLPRETSPLPSPSVCPPPPPCKPSLKRRRALSDVDGPNTAALCCKKRRLRRFLITSRLSQPFSQPATHILNRESVASGDKRFLKLAAIMNARRILGSAKAPHTPVASESLRRGAMANRLRRRLYAEATAASTAGRPLTGIPLSLMANMANARFTIVPVSTAGRVPGATATPTATAAAPITPIASAASSAVFAPVSGSTVAKSPPLSPHRPIVRAVSRSPKLRPVKDPKVLSRLQREADYRHDRHYEHFDADDDAECTAFPASEHASATDSYDDDDDTEDVYADFSVLFSSATAGDELDDLDGLDGLDGLDDYMDELDGIAHLPR